MIPPDFDHSSYPCLRVSVATGVAPHPYSLSASMFLSYSPSCGLKTLNNSLSDATAPASEWSGQPDSICGSSADSSSARSRTAYETTHIDVIKWSLHMAQIVAQEEPDASSPKCVRNAVATRIHGGLDRSHADILLDESESPAPPLSPPPPSLFLDDMMEEIDSPSTLVAEDDSFDFLDDQDNETLLLLRRDRRNLVLDSTCPHIAPHIVITPPQLDWSLFHVMAENATPAQSPEFLTVPPAGACVNFTQDVQSDVPQIVVSEYFDEDADFAECHSLCFSRSMFSQMIERSSWERLMVPDLVTTLNKRLYSVCACLASDEAHELQRHYEKSTSNPFAHLETEYKWTDPALPLLAEARKFFGALIIDSPTPSLTPHIIINEPPLFDANPWINIYNSTQNPQDCAFGRYLTVPSKLVEVVNSPRSGGLKEPPSSESTPDSSVPATPLLLTLIEAMPAHSPYTAGLLCDELDNKEMDIPDLETFSELDETFVCQEEYDSESDYGSQEEEEEGGDGDGDRDNDGDGDGEDLPPLDDWYQQIASRTGVLLQHSI